MKPAQPPTSDHERRLGALVHIGAIFGPLWIPLAVWGATRNTLPYVAAHAWQEFRDAILWKGLLLVVAVISLSFTLVRLVHHYQTDWREVSWQEIALRVAISLAVLAILWVWNLVQALAAARAAYKGIWPKRALKASDLR